MRRIEDQRLPEQRGAAGPVSGAGGTRSWREVFRLEYAAEFEGDVGGKVREYDI